MQPLLPGFTSTFTRVFIPAVLRTPAAERAPVFGAPRATPNKAQGEGTPEPGVRGAAEPRARALKLCPACAPSSRIPAYPVQLPNPRQEAETTRPQEGQLILYRRPCHAEYATRSLFPPRLPFPSRS